MKSLIDLRHAWLVATAAALLCLPLATATADDTQEKSEKGEQRIELIVTAQDDASQEQTAELDVEIVGDGPQQQILGFRVDAEAPKPGKYWIGVLCTPLEDDLLKTHLGLEHGMVITKVMEDSPAETSGLQAKDIMVLVNGEPLKDLKVLATNIEKAGKSEVVLTIVRKGDHQKIEITPAKRPVKVNVQSFQPDAESAAEWKMLQEALRKHGAVPQHKDHEDAHERDMSLMLVMPGVILPDQAQNLPKNLEVTISKKGKEEAKITVKQGDKKWEVNAKSLDQLPEEIRPHIEKMLGQGHEMKFHFEADGFNWFHRLPKELKAPRIIERSLQIAPDKVYELHKLEQGLNKELREKIQLRLKEANRALEEAKTKIPAEALERVERELKILREQIEQLRKERLEEDDEEDD